MVFRWWAYSGHRLYWLGTVRLNLKYFSDLTLAFAQLGVYWLGILTTLKNSICFYDKGSLIVLLILRVNLQNIKFRGILKTSNIF